MNQILRKCNWKISSVMVIAAVLLLSPSWSLAEEKAEAAKSDATIQSASYIRSASDAPLRQHYGRHYDRFLDRVDRGRGGPEGAKGRGSGEGMGMGRGPGNGMGMGRGSGFGPRGFNPSDFGGRGPEWRSYVREQFSAPDRMERLRKDSPEVVEIIAESKSVIKQIESVISAAIAEQAQGTIDSAKLKSQLQPLLNQECDLEMKRKYLELEIMEKKIKQIRETLDKRKKYQSRLVELKLNRILEDPATALADKKSIKKRPEKEE